MAGLPEEVQKKLSEGKDLTADEAKLVRSHLDEIQRDVEFHKGEAKKAFDTRDEVKRKLREREEAEEAEKNKNLSEAQRLQKLVDETNEKLKAIQPKAEEWDKYKTSRLEELKQKAGEAWQDSFGSLPIADLEKLVAKLTETKKPGPGAPPGGGADLPKSWQECLNDPDKMAMVDKYPDLKAKLKREYQSQKAR